MAAMHVSLRCTLLLSIIQLVLLKTVGALILDRCTLARKMHELNVPRQDLSRWIWIVERLSDFQTGAVAEADTEGYMQYGLFQFSGKYWCKPLSDQEFNISINLCNVDCEDLLSDNIEPSVRCAEHARKTDGWSPWKRILTGFGVSNQTSVDDCFEEVIDANSLGIAAVCLYTSKDFM